MSDLTPCSSCQRHVAGTETACPFCGACLSCDGARRADRSKVPHKNKRVAWLAMATTLAGADVTACGGTVYGVPPSDDESFDRPSASPAVEDEAGAPGLPAPEALILECADLESPSTVGDVPDGGVPDGGVPDGGTRDARTERGVLDGGTRDASAERGATDAAGAAPRDTGVPDAGG